MSALINHRWPEDLCPTSCEFSRTRNDVRQVAWRTRKSKVIRRGRPYWGASLTWVLPNTDKLAKLRWLLDALEGSAGSVQLWDFGSPYPAGVELATGDGAISRLFWTDGAQLFAWADPGLLPQFWTAGGLGTLASAASIGATSVSVSGLDAGKIAAIQGQYIQIGRRIYLVAATAIANGSGVATITFAPGLLSAANAGDQVRFTHAACEMELVSQSWPQGATAGDGLVTVRAEFVETGEDKI